jgi:hypothetical protein
MPSWRTRLFLSPEPAIPQVNRRVDERAMNNRSSGWRTAGISFAPGRRRQSRSLLRLGLRTISPEPSSVAWPTLKAPKCCLYGEKPRPYCKPYAAGQPKTGRSHWTSPEALDARADIHASWRAIFNGAYLCCRCWSRFLLGNRVVLDDSYPSRGNRDRYPCACL